MRHNIYFFNSDNFFMALLVIIVAIVVILSIKNKRSSLEKDPNPSDEKVIENFDSLVISMLNQNHGGLMQPEISTNLNLSLDLVSKELIRMETEKIIKREWINEQYTYKILLIK